METCKRKVLPPEVCKRIYDDFVRKPYISLTNILDFELYEVSLFCILPKDFYFHLNNDRKIREWSSQRSTFEAFKSCIFKVVANGECQINLRAIHWEAWLGFVVSNSEVYRRIHHWRTGGEVSFTHRWSFLQLPEDRLENMWRLLTLT